MSKRNVRIAIRDTTDSHNVGFFDNKSGIKYNSANLTQFLKGACSVLVLTYHSKKMVAQSGQKLAFRFKDKDFWLNINSVKKTGYKIELTAYSLSLEANKEKRGPHKPANAMSIKQYIDYYDPEHSFEIGINEVADKSIKLEWSGTDTILARLYSVANSFGAELEFVTELNNDYSLKRHVVNIYREGNLGKDKTGMPVRVGEKLKVINYSDNMDDFYTAIRRTGKDGLTMAGLNKKIYDDKGNLLFYNNSNTIYAPQARDKYPSIARKTNDGYIINEDSETEHTSKEALFGYMLAELKKHCELKVDYEVEGAVDGNIGDRKTLIDGRHFDPPLYVQARISEQTEALLETSDVKTTLSNYVRKSSQIANELLQRVEQLTLEATPYTIKLATNNGIVFKNNQGQSTIYPSLKRGQKPVECTWKWLVDNQGFGTSPTFEVQAAGMSSKLVLTAIALIDGKEVAREQVTFSNVNDGAKGSDGKSITVAKAEKQADGVKVTFSDNKSIVVPKGDKGDPADPVPLNALQEEMKQTKQGLSDVKTDLLKEKAESSANIEQVKKEVGAISSQQTAYEQSNKQNLARITGQLADKASKSEVKQTADGIREEISQISVGGRNLLRGSKGEFKPDSKPTGFDNQVLYVQSTSIDLVKGEKYLISAKTDGVFSNNHNGTQESDNVVLWLMDKTVTNYQIVSDSNTGTTGTVFTWNKPTGTYHLRVNTYHKDARKKVWEVKVEQGTIKTDWSPAPEDVDEQITVAKTTLEKTAEGLKTDMVAVKSYAANDGKRKEELEKYSREETAKQIAAERIKTAENYVGKIQYTEDVKGVNRRFEGLRTGTSNLLLNTEFKTLADVNNVNGATLKLNQNDYNSHNSIEVTVTGQNKDVWEGITLNASVSAFKKGDTIAVRMPIYIFSDVPINAGLTLVLKNHPKNIGYVFKDLGDLPRNKWHIVEFLHTFDNDANFEGVNFFYLYTTQNGHYKIAEPSLTLSNVIPSSWAPAVEDSKNYTDTKLAEYKQGVDGQLAAVKQEVGSKVSQTTFDQRANQITQSVQELSNNTVKKNQLKIDENGLVSSSEKTVNGQTLASMISQNPEWVEIIAKLLKIKADMIVNGAITADKLNVEKLSALASNLGKVKAGEIINEYRTAGTYGEIKIGENIKITNHNTAGARSHIPKEEIMMLPNGFLMNAYDAADRLTYTMRISPEVIEFQKINNTQAQGGTGSWSLGYSNSYSLLSIDAVLQKTRLQATSNLMFGVGATFVRIGNLVTISVTRDIKNISDVVENARARERIPDGFKPISQVHLILVGNDHATIDATCIVHLEPDGTINYTNNKSGSRVWTGTVTYTTVDDFPIVGNVPNGKLI
ncbi:phage tail protein [Streptococcus anginosus]|uniref:Phage tail protein n=2 Tax=Streptococcus TaxID=1301 RepID=A0ABD4U3R8_STRAP|nr:phage tail protein [Streptococcus anginosus]MCW1075716.1 phage tail protein [Streptococcus anginosus]